MQEFYINQYSTLPTLRMELIEDGRHDYNKFFEAIQNADITFTMVNLDTGITKIAKAPCYIKRKEGDGCVEQYVICYDWKERDTKEKGVFKGMFTINFSRNLKNDNYTYPIGTLEMPIRDDLYITIK